MEITTITPTISAEKWFAMALLTFLSVIFGIFPYIIFSYYRQVIRSDSYLCKTVIQILSSICGGVLLSTTILHILPEVRQKAAAHKNEEFFKFMGSELPPAEMLTLLGFCIIYGLEEIAQFLLKLKCGCTSHKRKDRKRQKHHLSSHQQRYDIGTKLDLNCTEDKYIPSSNGIVIAECQHVELIAPECNKALTDQICSSCDSPISMTLSHSNSQTTSSTSSPSHLRGSVLTLNQLDEKMTTPLGALRTLVSLLALSFHAVMEGVAVGVEKNQDNLWMTFGAIASHKCIIALCLGMEMMKSNMNWKTLVTSILIFSVVSPIGICIGSIMASENFGKSVWVVVIEGLAVGTLLYIIFFEILPPSHDHNSSDSHSDGDNYYSSDNKPNKKSKLSFLGMLRFIGTFFGVLFAAYLISIISHTHNHDNILPLKENNSHADSDDHAHHHHR